MYICSTQKGNNIMNTQDLTENRNRIIAKINYQITRATSENIKAVMIKIVAMLPQFENEKPTKANIDKLTMKAITSYIKYGHKFTAEQANAVDAAYQLKQKESRPSSLQY
jgi:hypothetical protein